MENRLWSFRRLWSDRADQAADGAFVVSPGRNIGLKAFRAPPVALPWAQDAGNDGRRCLIAWHRSDESTGFPAALRLHSSSHGIPMLASAPLPERIIESQQVSCCPRRAVTKTAGRVGRYYTWQRVPQPRARRRDRGPPLDAARRAAPTRAGEKPSVAAPAPTSPAHHLRPSSGLKNEIFRKTIREKPVQRVRIVGKLSRRIVGDEAQIFEC
jgi:hypothetical protein